VAHLHTRSQEHTPARSVALTTAEMSEAFLLAASRALGAPMEQAGSTVAVVPMVEAASMAVVADIGDHIRAFMEFVGNSKMEDSTMLQNVWILVRFEGMKFIRCAAAVVLALSLASSLVPTFAQQPGQSTFVSVEDAGRAFFTAMQSPDDRFLMSILGPAGKDIVSSGDSAEDLDARTRFTAKYQEMHRFITEPDGKVTLVVGAENWPLPIPLVNKSGAWYFDTLAGKDEILFRRIGKNELAAIQASRELVDAQKQYYARAPKGFAGEYAKKLVSDVGRYNGLYWEGTEDQFESPINPLIAYARQNLPKSQVGANVPFDGYFFRILTSQGPHAAGGTKDYVVGGKMTAGFAFVAYPAEYRTSGVMTFIVNKSGVVYEKDLGPNTTELARAMTIYDPDSSWHKAE
jgi:hypothetical protein